VAIGIVGRVGEDIYPKVDQGDAWQGERCARVGCAGRGIQKRAEVLVGGPRTLCEIDYVRVGAPEDIESLMLTEETGNKNMHTEEST
jgi:hypothetical protein